MTLPDWVDLEAWAGFVTMRKAIKAPLTDRAATLTINKLKQLREEGYDPNEALDQSTQRCWRGIFPVQGQEPKAKLKPIYSASDKAFYEEMRKKHPEMEWPV
jgi:hypothetical protein